MTTMKTERLKEDADASKGFVISFDDEDKPKKPKPELKNRRLSSTSAFLKSIMFMKVSERETS